VCDHHRHDQCGAEKAHPRQVNVQKQSDCQSQTHLGGHRSGRVAKGLAQRAGECRIGQQVLIVRQADEAPGEQGLVRRPSGETEVEGKRQR